MQVKICSKSSFNYPALNSTIDCEQSLFCSKICKPRVFEHRSCASCEGANTSRKRVSLFARIRAFATRTTSLLKYSRLTDFGAKERLLAVYSTRNYIIPRSG